MANKYVQTVNSAKTRFTQAPMGELEFSTMYANPKHTTDFDAGDIVPILCEEVLPNSTFEIGLDYVIRQATVAVPTMDQLNVDYYAFFVPNRVVNHSWKNVMGENSSGAWANDEDIVLAPLYHAKEGSTQIPVCSVADYYGIPTQAPIPNAVLAQMHDLKFRGYLDIYNTYFRDQNYQPPIPYSKLNIYNGFFLSAGTQVYNEGVSSIGGTGKSTGQYGSDSVVNAVAGDGGYIPDSSSIDYIQRYTSWSALSRPLKANRLHDYFSSVLPTPQKSREVVLPVFGGNLKLNTTDSPYVFDSGIQLNLGSDVDPSDKPTRVMLAGNVAGAQSAPGMLNYAVYGALSSFNESANPINTTNLVAQAEGFDISISDIRMSSAMQQVYEILGRSGSRYVEYINSFFGLEVDNPFDDIPTYLGHFRNELDLFQTAQTSASPSSQDGAGTPQGNLSAFGYTSKGGSLFTKTFNEHGYIHILAVIRHKNVYSSLLSRDNFRRSMMDFYQYPLANITEQPVYTREINPFLDDIDNVFGYQEAWAEYRMSPDRVSGHMRPGVPLTLSYWTYADEFDPDTVFCDGDWLVSNTAEVVRRTTAIQDQELPQFKGEFIFRIKKQLPMPTYSVAGLDII